jgi:hypothetical protein
MQYGPENNTWVYFRYDGQRKVMVAFNANAQDAVLPSARFHEMLSGVAAGTDVLTGKRHDLGKEIRLPAKSVVILEL